MEYACADGSPFPVTFADAGDPDLRWVLDREHAPSAMSPLADAVRRAGRGGTWRAYAEVGLEPPSMLVREPPLANGYDYVVDHWLIEAEREPLERALAQLAERHGGSLGVWLRHSLPPVRDACEWLEVAPASTSFAALAERLTYAWSHTGIVGLVARRDLDAVAESCRPLDGEQSTIIAHRLAQGSENDTLSADEALAAVAGGRVLDGYLAAFGSRATAWSIDHPTLRERPDLVDAQLRALQRSVRDPGSVRAEAVDRRRRLAEDVRARLPDQEQRYRFERRLARLGSFVPIREARARWQLVAVGALRRAVLARGRVLVDRGVLETADDVRFLNPEEYDDPSGEIGEAVEHRRADHRRWTAVTPPAGLGAAARPGAAPGAILRGAAGAPGSAAGPARVILDLGEADRLERGEILVTRATSPPWTPLFGIAAAVVTDAGDVLSHVAIAAREYGIPCVVGTHHATGSVRSGDGLVVDGDAGTVRIER